MANEQILVTIDQNADVTVEAKGFKGKGCQAFTAAVEKAIGKTIGDSKTPEFFQPEHAGRKVEAR